MMNVRGGNSETDINCSCKGSVYIGIIYINYVYSNKVTRVVLCIKKMRFLILKNKFLLCTTPRYIRYFDY